MPLNTNLQAVATEIWTGKWFTVCSIYLPHIDVQKKDIPPPPWRYECQTSPLEWRKTQPKRNFFVELLIEVDLNLLNNNKPTHYHIQTNSITTIDLSIVPWDSYLCFNYKIPTSLHGSDQYPISKDKVIAQEAREPSNWF